MEGIIQFLLSKDPYATKLLNLYIFKIIPMLNPDGVIIGNFRCSASGADLNRRWILPDQFLHTQIFYLKNYIKKIISEGKNIIVFCDLHSHSKDLNSFIYGCNKAAEGSFCTWTKVQLLPRIIAKNTHLFSLKNCLFRVESSKVNFIRKKLQEL